MRSALATVVFLGCLPICIAGAAVLALGLGIGWCAIQLAPSAQAWHDAFDLPVPPQ